MEHMVSLAADPNKKNRAESEVFAEESRNIFGIYLQRYCQAMTNAKAEPPRSLALYYARILPHVLHIMYGIETIPDSKGLLPHGRLNICRKNDGDPWRTVGRRNAGMAV